jgi:hypothetical protein
LIFRRRTSEAEAAEAATLRALLRQKADDCFKAGQFLAPKSRVLEEMAEKETDLKSAERLYGNAFEAETEARAAFAVAHALNSIVAIATTKAKIISEIDRFISEFTNDAARNYTKAKTAWREKARLDAGKEAVQSERTAKVLNDFLLELGKQGQGGNNR